MTVAGINLVYQFWVHTEHIPKLGWYEYVFVSPSNHRIHHAQNKHYVDANYGGVFIFWDRLFGTYKEELDELKPIYGTAKPLRSWNPFKANLDIFAEMIKDSTRTKSIKNKIKVWFSRPNWRPDDVKVSHPIYKNDLDNFEPYNPSTSFEVKIYSWIQLFFIMGLSAAVTASVASQSFQDTSIFAITLLITSTIALMSMEKYELSFLPEILRSSAVIIFFLFGNVVNSELLITQLFIFQSLFNIVLVTLLKYLPKLSFSN